MRLDDPHVLHAIEQIEQATDTLRRLALFPPRIETPETTASRKARHDCRVPGCNLAFRSEADLRDHLHALHDGVVLDGVIVT